MHVEQERGEKGEEGEEEEEVVAMKIEVRVEVKVEEEMEVEQGWTALVVAVAETGRTREGMGLIKLYLPP